MTDKPQTLGDQIRALAFADPYEERPCGYNEGIAVAAALADAATTTTPVVVAKQAGDVRQAVRAWLLIDKATGKEKLVDGAKHNPTDPLFWVSSEAMASCDIVPLFCAALEPDPTPALGWKAMQTAAELAVREYADGIVNEWAKQTIQWAADYVSTLPGPTDEQLLADAVKLLLRDALMVEHIDAVADACREFKIKPELFRAALAKIGEAK